MISEKHTIFQLILSAIQESEVPIGSPEILVFKIETTSGIKITTDRISKEVWRLLDESILKLDSGRNIRINDQSVK